MVLGKIILDRVLGSNSIKFAYIFDFDCNLIIQNRSSS